MALDGATITLILSVLAVSAAVSKYIAHSTVAALKKESGEMIKALQALTETLQNFQIQQTEKNGEFVTRSNCQQNNSEIYQQIDNIRDRVSTIEGRLSG